MSEPQLSVGWWKKHKPLTLRKEPLTKALAEAAKAEAEADKFPSRESLTRASGAVKIVAIAAQQTLPLCNKTLHKDTIKALPKLQALAKARYGIIQQMLKQFNVFLTDFHKVKDALIKLVDVTEKNPTQSNIEKCVKCLKLIQDMSNRAPVGSAETRKTAYLANAVSDDLKKLGEKLAEFQAAPVTTAEHAKKKLAMKKYIDSIYVSLRKNIDLFKIPGLSSEVMGYMDRGAVTVK